MANVVVLLAVVEAAVMSVDVGEVVFGGDAVPHDGSTSGIEQLIEERAGP